MEQIPEFISILQQGYRAPQSITSNLKSLLSTGLERTDQNNIETEIKCFDYYLRNGKLNPLIERIDEKGNNICYPDIHKFSEDDWAYIESRLSTEQHPFLIARYAHLIWLYKKDNRYAQKAIEAYKELALLYFQKAQQGDRLYHHFSEAIKNFHLISSTIKYKAEDCKKFMLSWLDKDDLPFMWKDNILDIITESPFFKSKDYQGITSKMLTYLNKEKYGYTVGKNFLESLLPLAQKEGVNSKEIYNLLGENELALASERQEDPTGIVPFKGFKMAAQYFKLAGEKYKYEQAAKLYTAQKHKIKLGLVSSELSDENVQRYNKFLNNLVDFLLSQDRDKIFWFFVTDDDIVLPSERRINNVLESTSSIMDLFTWEVFDQNNNGKTLSEEEKKSLDDFRSYSLYLQIMTLPLMERLFYKGLKTGKITQETFMSFFGNTWLAQQLNGYTLDGEVKQYSWMELLGPGLNQLIIEIESHIQAKTYQPNYILSIDSISIKLEGAIRDYAIVSGVPVSKMKEGETQEMNLEELLSNENVLVLFDTKDVLLWKTVLTKKGWNIRNNTAHGFYRPEDYSKQKAFLLLLSVYRLSGYKLHFDSN